jgi:hypothetical protein
MSKFENLTGATFGKLKVLERTNNFEGVSDSRAQYVCQCKCGNKEKVVARYLKRGDKKACIMCTPKGTPKSDLHLKVIKLENRIKHIENLLNLTTQESE